MSLTAAVCDVLVIDDHPVVRHGLAALLTAEPWVSDVQEAGSIAEAVRLATGHRPGLAVVDLALPDGNGIDLIGRLPVISPGCVTLVLTMSGDRGSVRAALAQGARGYVLKDSAPAMIVAAARTVAAGGHVFSAEIPQHGLGPETPADVLPKPLSSLNPRELRLVRMLATGESNRRIASALSITEKTVRNQVSMVLVKLGVGDRVQAALLAHRAGLAD